MRDIWGSFWRLSIPLKIVLTAVLLFALLVAIVLLALLSPLMIFLTVLAFSICVGIVLYRMLSRRPLAINWAIGAGSCIVLIFVFSGVSSAIYGGGETEEIAEREPTVEETTRIVEEERTEEEVAYRERERKLKEERERKLKEERQRKAEEAEARKAAEREREAAEREAAEREREEREAAKREAAERVEREAAAGAHTATVTNVVDGDTIDISPAVDGVDRVRVIGVDAPETSFGIEPLGYEATAFADSLLYGREITLEFDVERTDPYERVLAYVYLSDGSMFNERLVAEGYGQVATYPPNVKYVDRFLAAQESARTAGRGLWGLTASEQCELADRGNGIGGCEVETPSVSGSGYGSEGPSVVGGGTGTAGGSSSPTGGSCPAGAPIKGNDSSSGELIYHSPGGAFYDRTNPEECFATGADAEAAGYRASQR